MLSSSSGQVEAYGEFVEADVFDEERGTTPRKTLYVTADAAKGMEQDDTVLVNGRTLRVHRVTRTDATATLELVT